jgi:kinesin family protein 11
MSHLSQSLRTSLEQETRKLFAGQEKEHSSHNDQLNAHFSTIQELLKEMKDQQRVEDKSLDLVEKELQSATLAFSKEVSTWGERLASTCSQVCEESNDTTTKQLGLLSQSISILHSLIGSISSAIQNYLKEERDALMQSHELAKKLATEEVNHLKRQNETLAKWVIDERKSSETAQADILQRFSGLLGEFFQKRDESLRESIGSLQRSNMEVEDLLASAGKRQAKDQEEMINRSNEMSDHLRDFDRQGHEAKKKGAQVGVSVLADTSNLICI